jgi:hypothetical protein
MKLIRGTRWWVFWPCLLAILVMVWVLSLKRRYTFEEAKVIMRSLSMRKATEAEVLALLGHHACQVLDPDTGQNQNRYCFSDHSFNSAQVHQMWGDYDVEGKLQSITAVTQYLYGASVWKYRWNCLLNTITP